MKESSTAIISDGKTMLYAKVGKGAGAQAAGGSLGAVPALAQFQDEDAFHKAEAEYSRKSASRAPDGATLAIPTTDAIFKTDFLPSTDMDELAAMSLNQAEKDAPLPMEEMTHSFEILEAADDGMLVLSVCAPSAAIEAVRAASGIEPAHVERVDALVCGTIAHLLAKGALSGHGRELLVAEEGDNATLAIVDFGRPVFIRSLGETAALDAAGIAKALRLALIGSKVRRGDGEVTGFVLFGDTQTMQQFAGAASAAAPGVQPRIVPHGADGAEASGVAARTMEGKSLNLFPQEWTDKLSEAKFKKRFGASCLAAAAAWLLLVGYLWGWPALIAQRVAALEAGVKRLEPAEASVNDLRNRIKIIDRYSDRSHSPLEALLEVAISLPPATVPPAIELTQFRYNGAKGNILVEGRSIATATIYSFMDDIKESPLFGQARLTGPTFNNTLRRNVFELSIDFKNAAQAEGGAAK